MSKYLNKRLEQSIAIILTASTLCALSGCKLEQSIAIILTASTLCALSGCNNSSNLESNRTVAKNSLWQQHLQLQNQYLKNNQEPPIHMSDGFDHRTGISKGDSCLINYNDPAAMHISNERGEIHFDSASDASTISSMIGASISGKANFGIFSASTNAQYARNISDTRQSIHFTYWQSANADVSFDVKDFGNDALRPSARELLSSSGGYKAFTEVCGDSFIKSAQIGALLIVDVAIKFASASDKSTLQTNYVVK